MLPAALKTKSAEGIRYSCFAIDDNLKKKEKKVFVS